MELFLPTSSKGVSPNRRLGLNWISNGAPWHPERKVQVQVDQTRDIRLDIRFFYIIEKGLACTIAIMVLYSHHSLGIQSYLLKFGTTGPSKRTHPSQGVRLDC